MFEILFTLIFLITFVFISGNVASKFVFPKNSATLEVPEQGLLGIIFLLFLSFILHIFFPLNLVTNSIIFFSLIILFIINNFKQLKKAQKFNYKIIIFSLTIVFIMTLKYKLNEDYGYYHLPYIINLISDKIIFGLANLQTQFAWNSSWLNFSSIFNLPFVEIRGTQLSNSILFFFVISFFLQNLFFAKNKNSVSFLFLFFLSCYTLIKFSRITEHGFDFPANIFLLLSFYYFIKIFEETDQFFIKKYFLLLLFFSLLSILIKLSTFAAPLLVFSSFIHLIKRKINLRFLVIPLLFSCLLFLLWIFQQFAFSGCFVPFLKFTCQESISWYTSGISEAVSGATGAVNKSFGQYSGSLSMEEYVKDFNWVSTWLKRNFIEFSEHIFAISIPMLILIIFNIKNFFSNKYKIKKIRDKNFFYITCFIFLFFSLIIWFIKSPVIRFGVPYIFIFFFFLFIIFMHALNLKLKRGFYFVIILSISFNLIKNLDRISNKNQLSYWPMILNFEYSKTEVNGFKVYYPDSKSDYHQTKYCWSIPYICHVNRGNGLNIYKKYGYTFIN